MRSIPLRNLDDFSPPPSLYTPLHFFAVSLTAHLCFFTRRRTVFLVLISLHGIKCCSLKDRGLCLEGLDLPICRPLSSIPFQQIIEIRSVIVSVSKAADAIDVPNTHVYQYIPRGPHGVLRRSQLRNPARATQKGSLLHILRKVVNRKNYNLTAVALRCVLTRQSVRDFLVWTARSHAAI